MDKIFLNVRMFLIAVFLTAMSADALAVEEPNGIYMDSFITAGTAESQASPCPSWSMVFERVSPEDDGGDIKLQFNSCKVMGYEVYSFPQNGPTGETVDLEPGDIFVIWDEDSGHGQNMTDCTFSGQAEASTLNAEIPNEYVRVFSTTVEWTVYTVTSRGTYRRTGSGVNDNDVVKFNKRLLHFTKTDNTADGECRKPGDEIIYTICWDNSLDPNGLTLENAKIYDYLPDGVIYDWIISSEPPVIDTAYNPDFHLYTWSLPVINPDETGCVTLKVKVSDNAEPGLVLHNRAEMWVNGIFSAMDTEDTDVCCGWNGVAPDIIHVDHTAKGYNNGTSWEHAYTDLQDALYRAETSVCGPADGYKIYVAQGIYSPGKLEDDTFALPDGVSVYGGFRTGGTDFEYRNPDRYETILDAMTDPNQIEQNNTCVTMGDNSLIDGFIIRDASKNGIVGDGASFIVENCRVVENIRDGIYALNGNVNLRWCEISNNGLQGIYHTGQGYTVKIENCVINENKWQGLLTVHSMPVMKNSVVARNGSFAPGRAGIDITYLTENPILQNNTICYNKKSGISFLKDDPNSLAYPEIYNNILWYNNNGNGQIYGEDPNFIFHNCIYDGNDVDGIDYTPDANGNFTGNPCFAYSDPNQYDDPDIPFNYHLAYDSPCINMGNPSLTYIDQNDIDTEQRIVGGRVDIGADEVCSCDGNLSADDIYNRLDRNADGILNYGEFVHFSRAWLTHDPCDPAIYDPNHVPEYYYYNDPNHPLYVDIEGGELDRWDAKCNLADTGASRYFIDMDDLMVFCRDGYWLWTACWKESQMNRFPRTAPLQTENGKVMTMASMPVLIESSAITEPASAATSAEGIAEIIDFVDAAAAGNPPNAEALYDMKIFLEEIITDLQ